MTEGAKQQACEESSDDAADEGDEDGFCEQLARNGPAAGTDGETDGQLAAAVRRARREDAGEIGAGGEQDEHGEKRHAEHCFLHGVVAVAGEPGFVHGEGEALVVWILFCHLPRNGSHVLRGLLLRDAGLESAEDGEFAVTCASRSRPSR